MIKLIKYEMKKGVFIKRAILGIIASLQFIFFVGLLTNSEDGIMFGYIFTIVASIAAILSIGFFGVSFYCNDLEPKHSELLFLHPCNMYQKLGAKIISIWIRCLMVCGVFLVTIVVDTVFWGLRSHQIWGLHEIAKIILGGNNMRKTCELIVILLGCFTFVYVGIFAVTIATLCIKEIEYRGVYSVIISLGLSFPVVIMFMIMFTWIPHEYHYLIQVMIYMGIFLIPKLLGFFGTCWLLKKVSV